MSPGEQNPEAALAVRGRPLGEHSACSWRTGAALSAAAGGLPRRGAAVRNLLALRDPAPKWSGLRLQAEGDALLRAPGWAGQPRGDSTDLCQALLCAPDRRSPG